MVDMSDSLKMKVSLRLSCKNLKNLDTFSKSDPWIIVKLQDNNGHYQNVGKTETINNNLNPEFATTLTVDFFFEKHQKMAFKVLDGDGKEEDASDDDIIGTVETTLGEIVGSGKYESKISHKGNDNRGTLIIQAETLQDSNQVAQIDAQAENLPPVTSCFGICSEAQQTRFTIYRGNVADPNQWNQVYRGPMKLNDWRTKVSMSALCNADYNCPVKFAFVNASGASIAETVSTVGEIVQQGKERLDLAPQGVLRLRHFKIQTEYQFIDYLRSGWQISLFVGIDFTGSNGNPSQPNSLHYLGGMNQYDAAIQQVGSILEPYDSDRSFPVYGFGGMPNGGAFANTTSHCFALNFDESNPEVQGTQGIAQLYRNQLMNVRLSGPTYFAPIIGQFLNITRARMAQNCYSVMLLLTDGEIFDMPQTIDLVVEASKLPCSIVIVGVGNEAFQKMEALDGDGGMLRSSRGEVAARDTVQFVKFLSANKHGKLAEEVLKEIPTQLVRYMQNCEILPAVAQV